ncbi:MAG: glycoside hydrolase family 18 protein [Dysgonomonas sp.]|nr:glycoside hydrolase family 18 protein [Dysgonomonas sp.]
MKKSILFSSLLIILLVGFTACPQKEEKPVAPVIIAYVGGYNGLADVDKIKANEISHINYAFVDVKDGKAFLTNEATDTVNFRRLNELKQQNPELKILISIGGWAWSKNFSDAVLTSEGQKTFAKSAVDIMYKYNLDGVDIDWEYPAMPGDEGNVYRPEDKENYTLMFAALREELNAREKESDKKFLLTTAVGGFQKFVDSTYMDKAQQYLDYINIMTYDNQSSEKAIHHTNLLPSDKYENSNSTSKAVDAYINAGVPKEKLVVGIAFYGRIYEMKKGGEKGLADPIVKQIQGKGYTYIKDSLVNKNEYFRYWDDAAQAPYLYNFYTGVFVTYDDEESVKAKCRYVKENGLAGVMFWEYSSDPKGYLLNAINAELR